jgi:8-oxo-dGTP pyrophosphatase MutT (NUDIX family)
VNRYLPIDDFETHVINALRTRKKVKLATNNLVRAAVLVPLMKNAGYYSLLFTKRHKELKNHPGQISFPGGLFEESDIDLKSTILREAWEELGIIKSDMNILGMLDDYASSTGYLISPFVGKIPYPYNFKINRNEVSEIIMAPLEELKKSPKTGYVMKNSEPYPVYYYELPNHVIWGATARIIKNFIEILFK